MILEVYVDMPVKFEVEVSDETIAPMLDEDCDMTRNEIEVFVHDMVDTICKEGLYPIVDKDVANITFYDVQSIFTADEGMCLYEG